MVFRNLRERFGIDDQDYQVLASLQNRRGQQVEWGQGATGQVGGKCLLFLCCVFLSRFCPAQAVFSSVLAGLWRGEGLGVPYDASQAGAPVPGRESSGRGGAMEDVSLPSLG